MSTTVTDVGSTGTEADEEAHGASDKQYFAIFWVLVVLTILEVSTELWDDWWGPDARKVAVPVLLVLMVIKFFLVALYFMHLKFDQPILRRIFWFGSIVAIAVYTGALSAMNFWEDSGRTRFNDPPPAVEQPAEGSDAPAAPSAGSGGTSASGGQGD